MPDDPGVWHFPPAKFRREPDWLHEPSTRSAFGWENDSIRDLLREIYICVQNDCRRSAAMAIRALLEHVMIEKVGDHGSFDKNMREFEAKGFVSAIQRKFLDASVEGGHATMHRGFNPSKSYLVSLVDIAESVVVSVYINPIRADQLNKDTPPRKP